MVKENHKKFMVIVGVEEEAFNSPFLYLQTKSRYFCGWDSLSREEGGQIELSREMVNCSISMCYEGCCERPFCPVWKYLNRKNKWSSLIMVPV